VPRGVLPLTGWRALTPVLTLLGLLVAAGLGYAAAQSLGLLPLTGPAGFSLDAYREVLGGRHAPDLWASAAFTLWVSAASTLVAAVIALAAVMWADRPRTGGRIALGTLHVNLAIPHVVWAVALLLVCSQSGILARAAAALGLVDVPSDFPVLVRDGYGLGIVLHYATKEAPFLALVCLAILRAQPRELRQVAETLGARGWRRMRLVTLPTVLPGLAAASALVFVFVFGAYEAPVLLGVSDPRALSVLSVDLFADSDLTTRPAAMALGMLMTGAVLAMVAAAWAVSRRRP